MSYRIDRKFAEICKRFLPTFAGALRRARRVQLGEIRKRFLLIFAGALRRVCWGQIGFVIAGFGMGVIVTASFYSYHFSSRSLPTWLTTNTKILEAYSLLRSTNAGSELLSNFKNRKTHVEVRSPKNKGTLGSYWEGLDRNGHIVLSPKILETEVSTECVSLTLAHEYTHAGQKKRGRNSLDHEMEAFFNEVLVLKELLGRGMKFEGCSTQTELEAFDKGRQAFEIYVEESYPKLAWLDKSKFRSGSRYEYYRHVEKRYSRLWRDEELKPVGIGPCLKLSNRI